MFAAYLHSAGAHEIAELRLGKKTEQLYEQAEKLHKPARPLRLRPAAGPLHRRRRRPGARRRRADRVRRRGRPIIVDRPLYRELVKTAIKRTHDELEAKAAAAAKEKKATAPARQPADPVTVAKRERDAQLRELTDQAHGANLDLGHALIHNLTSVDPTDIDVARFFVYALLGADHDSSPYTQTGERIARIAAGGIRLVIDELRSDVTKTRKDGSRGRLRIDYGEHRNPHAALAWLWTFIDGAKTASELYGRALSSSPPSSTPPGSSSPSSQRMPATRWSSHKDIAAKALKKLAGPHVPASLSKLEQAVKRAHAAYDKAEAQVREQQRAERQATEPEADDGMGDELDEDLDDAA